MFRIQKVHGSELRFAATVINGFQAFLKIIALPLARMTQERSARGRPQCYRCDRGFQLVENRCEGFIGCRFDDGKEFLANE
jgi:hypothetical protein